MLEPQDDRSLKNTQCQDATSQGHSADSDVFNHAINKTNSDAKAERDGMLYSNTNDACSCVYNT